jgi:hypothetical protein
MTAAPSRARAYSALVTRLLASACLVCLGYGRADAQFADGLSTRPYESLFGGAAEQPEGTQGLFLNGALFAGYDDDIFARGVNPGFNRPRISGDFVGSQLSATYFRQFATSTLSAFGASASRYLPEDRRYVQTFTAGAVAYQAHLNAVTAVEMRQAVTYRPFFSPAVFPPANPVGPSLGAPGDVDDIGDFGMQGPDDFTLASDRGGVLYTTTGRFRRKLSARSRLDFRGLYGVGSLRSVPVQGLSNRRWLLGGRYTHDVSPYLAGRLGYAYRTYSTRSGGKSDAHDIDVGLMVNRPFIYQRGRTAFSFTTGTTMVVRERLEPGDTGDRFLLRAIGTANLAHAFRSSWQAEVDYAHLVGFIDGFADPVEGDRVLASLGGLITRALDLSMSVGYLNGAVGMRTRNFDTTLANARLRLALTRNLALFAQYFYYQYAYDEGIADQLLIAPDLERQGFRAGLTVWLPLLR